jgi:hypothetical protein
VSDATCGSSIMYTRPPPPSPGSTCTLQW